MSVAVKIDLSAIVHVRPGRTWMHLTAWEITGGKYGSVASCDIDLTNEVVPRDREELVALVLSHLGQVAYG